MADRPQAIPMTGHSPYGIYTRHGHADRDWMIQAICRAHDPEMFFPNPGDRRAIREAVRICDTCPVLTECRQHAEKQDVPYGIWGGELRNRTVSTGYVTPKGRQPAPIPICGTERAYRRHLRRGETADKACKKAAVDAWHQRKTERSQR